MRAALYTRSASVSQKTVEFHDPFMACQTFADREGIEVVAAFEDAGASGISSIDRPGFLDLMQAAKTGAFDVAICEGLDRLSRSQADILDIVENLRVLDVSVITLAEDHIDGMQVCKNGTLAPPRLKAMQRKAMTEHQGNGTSPSAPEPETV
ncbi:recombinase family protein [Brevundimonas diminuta]|uniref:recombinase family protein n=1 Tax=Brevundimonas diminuta TaxID=293 RepID=UPI0037C820DF